MPEEKELRAVEIREGQRPGGMGSGVPIPGVLQGVPWSRDGAHFPGCGVVSVRMLRTARGDTDPMAP